MSKKVSLGAAVAMACVAAAVTVSLTYVYAMDKFNSKMADVNQRQAMYAKLSEIDQKARQDYIGQIGETALNDGIAAGYIAGLSDPNGKYMSAEKYKSYLNANSGNNVGVGILTLKDSDGNMEITEVLPNSPGEKSGLKKGDVIVAVDGKEVIRLSYAEALNKLDGSAGSTVVFTVLRNAETPVTEGGAVAEISTETLTIECVRAEYQRNTMTSTIINGNVGYLLISEFQEDSDEQFRLALDQMAQQVSGLVIDLRSNSGGSVQGMAKVLDILLPAGNIVNVMDKEGKTTVEFTSKSDQLNLPVCVVINENTYGAAEIFAAGIQDYKKGKLVGAKTVGFGTKDEVMPLSDGSAIVMSVAYYTRLNGETFNGKGIEPDMKISLSGDQQLRLERKTLAVKDDPQIQAAVTALVSVGADVKQLPGATE